MRNNRVFRVLTLIAAMVLLIAAFPGMPVYALTGSASVSPISGVVGTAVTLTGTGFTAGSTYYINFDVTTVGNGTVPAGGAISTVFYVPAAPRGLRNVSVTTSAGDTTVTPVPTFTVAPEIQLSTSSGYGLDTISVNGTGFAALSTINIYFDSSSVGSISSGANGSITSAAIRIPDTYRGNHSIYANDGVGPSPSYNFNISPRITLAPPSGPVGAQIAVSGAGFTANSNVTFSVDGTIATTPAVTTTAQGGFTLSNFTIPASSYGSHTITAQDAGGGSASSTFSASQTMTINPPSGTSGAAVTVTGSGFGANKNISITYGGIAALTSPATVVADANGNFTATLTVPPSGGGAHPIAATDGTISASQNFSIVGTATITAAKGPVGTPVTVSGNGFTALGNIVIKLESAQLAQVTSDASGAFTASIKIPPAPGGDHTISVSDGYNTKTFPFNITPVAGLDTTTKAGYVGSDVSVSGSGFKAGATVNVSYDSIRVTSGVADSNGSFKAAFKAPVSKGGNHAVTITDGTNTSTDTFAMDSTPPPVPLLISPPDKTKADALADFIWSGVTDPSGVTYDFQLATDAAFNAIVLEKKNMTNPGYKITDKEKLPTRSAQEPYYWRVKAIDAASNDSGWSAPYTFFVGFVLPQWGIYAIAGAAVIIFFFLGFWLGRRSTGMDGGGDTFQV